MADLPPLLQAALQLRAETSISRLFLPAMDDNNRPPLSPDAQAVMNAYVAEDRAGRLAVAAALRAAADQVAPEDYSSYTGHTEYDFALEARNDSVREAILAIATELETSTTENR